MQHKDINIQKWALLSLEEQMANIGSEVGRAINWRNKNNPEYANMANIRALELFDLTLSTAHTLPALKEIARARELWLDFFIGENQYQQTQDQQLKYFTGFNFLAALNKPVKL
jgi:hypothetical protein